VRGALTGGVLLLIFAALIAGCSGGANQAKTPAAGTVTTTAVTAAVVASPVASNAGPAADRLTAAALIQSEVPPGLQLNAKRPFSNHDYAAAQADPASFEQQLNDGGRTTGVVVQWAGPQTSAVGQATTAGLLEVLSQWRDADSAHAGLATTLNAVASGAQQPGAVKVDTSPADLGAIGDEVSAQHIHVAAAAGGAPDQDFYIVGLRVGAATAILIVNGSGGAPTQDAVRQMAVTQAAKLH